MELWIRSQNKSFLVKADNVVIDNNGLSLYTHANKDCNDITYELGTYKTKERTLEVLDDIQDTLIAKYVTSLNSRAAILETEEETTKALKKMAVYEMPEE